MTDDNVCTHETSSALQPTQDAVNTSAAVYVDEDGRLQLQGYRDLLTDECVHRSSVLSEILNTEDLHEDVAVPVSDVMATAWISAVRSEDKRWSDISAKQLAITLMVRNMMDGFLSGDHHIVCASALPWSSWRHAGMCVFTHTGDLRRRDLYFQSNGSYKSVSNGTSRVVSTPGSGAISLGNRTLYALLDEAVTGYGDCFLQRASWSLSALRSRLRT